jgi:hypothetical protein
MKRLFFIMLILLAVLPVSAQDEPVLPVINHQTILADPVRNYGEPGNFTNFGIPLSVSGDQMAVGSPSEYFGLPHEFQGAVYIYRRVGQDWAVHTRLGNPVKDSLIFGRGVALDGTTLGVTASNGVYIYELIGDTWTQAAFFAKSLFITSTALRNGVLVVSDIESTVWTYRRDINGTWQAAETLTTSLPIDTEFYGTALALSEDGLTLAVGAPPFNSLGGNVYIYNFNGTAWQLSDTLTEPEAGAFGYSLEMVGTGDAVTLAVGAPANTSGEFLAAVPGSAFIYTRSAGLWLKTLSVSDPITSYAVGYGQFGRDVELIAGGIVVSSFITGDSSVDLLPGRLYAFDMAGQQVAEIISPRSMDANGDGRNDYDAFGEAIEVAGAGDGIQLIANAPTGVSFLEFGYGKVYIFDHDPNAFELVDAGDFEPQSERYLILNRWNRSPGAVRQCKNTGADSPCSILFKTGIKSQVWQNIDLSQVTLASGDALMLQADTKVNRDAVLRLRLTVTYTDGFSRTIKVLVKNTRGEYKRVLSAPGLFIADRPIGKIIVRADHNGKQGTARLDNVSLVWVGGD